MLDVNYLTYNRLRVRSGTETKRDETPSGQFVNNSVVAAVCVALVSRGFLFVTSTRHELQRHCKALTKPGTLRLDVGEIKEYTQGSTLQQCCIVNKCIVVEAAVLHCSQFHVCTISAKQLERTQKGTNNRQG